MLASWVRVIDGVERAVRCGACSHGYGVTGRGVGVTISSHVVSPLQAMRHYLCPDNEQQRLCRVPRQEKKKEVCPTLFSRCRQEKFV